MQIKTITVGPFEMNCYLLGCEETCEGFVIDPGEEPERIQAAMNASGWTFRGILLTHGHLDHIGAVAFLKQAQGLPIYLHSNDLPLYQNLPQQGRAYGFRFDPPPPVDRLLQDGQTLTLGNLSLSVIHTPGHSPGAVCYHVREAGILFAGDTLFAQSIGRTDLPGGSYPTLIQSITTKLMVLDDATTVYCGHGPSTTIGLERHDNPFLQADPAP
jgi:glyoxylase-like metal-dependent hydrolase (beta-lactamase superfamily II)